MVVDRAIGRSLEADILARVSEGPESRCLCFCEQGKSGIWLSRERVYRYALGAARKLGEDGVRAGDICVVVLPSGEAAARTVIAILLLGAVPLLLVPPGMVAGNLDVARSLRRILRQTRPRLVI